MSAVYAADDRWTSWGRVVRARHYIARPRFADQIGAALADAADSQRTALPVGLGRSYGDSNLNPEGALIDLSGVDRFISFDAERGVLRAEAGVSLSEILKLVVPHGWFLPTTPGTRFVTLGGAIANDLHGKNHESAGSFGRWVRRIGLIRSDRGALELAADLDPDLFAATIGGLGLTGVIAWAELQLTRIASVSIDEETLLFDGLSDFFDIAEASAGRFEYNVAWIDCTATGEHVGRGYFTRGNVAPSGPLTAHSDRRALSIGADGAAQLFNPLFLRGANAAIRALQQMKGRRRRVHYASHLFPLDSIGSWNRLYGRGGFYQYQCVVPASGRSAIGELLQVIAEDGAGSFLAVLKSFGSLQSPGLLSFPMPGVTLAMDFVNAGARTLSLFARMDEIVAAAGGRLYCAKDGRIPAHMFQAGYPRWRQFAAHVDAALSSSFWRRVSA